MVSQFTLYGNCRKGRRPSFTEAAPPELGEAMYERFLELCRAGGFPPQHGKFGAHMEVTSVNDGPVTLLLDTDQLMEAREIVMIHVETLPLGPLGTNCYLVYREEAANAWSLTPVRKAKRLRRSSGSGGCS